MIAMTNAQKAELITMLVIGLFVASGGGVATGGGGGVGSGGWGGASSALRVSRSRIETNQ